MADPINPSHYKAHASGVEAIDICEHMGFSLGNAIKYIWRAGLKSEDPIEDIRKAIWYLEREVSRIEKGSLGKPRKLLEKATVRSGK